MDQGSEVTVQGSLFALVILGGKLGGAWEFLQVMPAEDEVVLVEGLQTAERNELQTTQTNDVVEAAALQMDEAIRTLEAQDALSGVMDG
jgi:hypothetical protein